jgi:hypothetical protein
MKFAKRLLPPGKPRSKISQGEKQMSIPVCTGGNCDVGVSSLSFTNSLAQSVTITSCTMPGWPNADPVVPAASNGVNGTKDVQLASRTTAGTYTYTTNPNCNIMATNPQIKVQ